MKANGPSSPSVNSGSQRGFRAASSAAIADCSPWRLPDNHFFLPYSIEDKCMTQENTPWEEREERALIFAKRSCKFARYSRVRG